MIEAYRREPSTAKAAAAAGVSKSWAYQVLRAEGLTRTSPQYSTRVRSEAIRLYAEESLSTWEVASRLAEAEDPAPTAMTVWEWVRAAGVTRSRSVALEERARKRNGIDYDEIRRQVRELATRRPVTVRGLARRFGVSRRTIQRALPAELRPDASDAQRIAHAARMRRQKVEVMRLRLEGRTYREITEATGLSSPTIYQYLRDEGLVRSARRRS